jgi:hypothetical protein
MRLSLVSQQMIGRREQTHPLPNVMNAPSNSEIRCQHGRRQSSTTVSLSQQSVAASSSSYTALTVPTHNDNVSSSAATRRNLSFGMSAAHANGMQQYHSRSSPISSYENHGPTNMSIAHRGQKRYRSPEASSLTGNRKKRSRSTKGAVGEFKTDIDDGRDDDGRYDDMGSREIASPNRDTNTLCHLDDRNSDDESTSVQSVCSEDAIVKIDKTPATVIVDGSNSTYVRCSLLPLLQFALKKALREKSARILRAEKKKKPRSVDWFGLLVRCKEEGLLSDGEIQMIQSITLPRNRTQHPVLETSVDVTLTPKYIASRPPLERTETEYEFLTRLIARVDSNKQISIKNIDTRKIIKELEAELELSKSRDQTVRCDDKIIMQVVIRHTYAHAYISSSVC